ncbi:transmembrane protein 186-like isoform X2 [Stegodyphus dumicola]|uniref:transmembrane protein 186-like isoform X2 n=1 Tax=Stegodyphus dumicola TaxID=202533 RepID=UPI0015B0F2BE|nr:transmembrane protein 186-like isoform X2 [Stegodyphus dumicola]
MIQSFRLMKHVQHANFYFKSLTVNAVRCLSKKALGTDVYYHTCQETVKDAEWTPVYYFPLINLGRLLNRFKLYQTTFTVAAIPIGCIMYKYNLVDLTFINVVVGAATFACLTLYVFTMFFRRFIGIIYVTKDEKYVKISHLTFWGRRNNIILPVQNLVPLTDGECKATDAYMKLHMYNSSEYLYLTLRFGRILDYDKFQNVFGNLEILGITKNK